jgi:hypothetical protein
MSNDLAPPHPPLSPVTKLSPVFRRSSLLTGEEGVGGGMGEESDHTTVKKPGRLYSLIAESVCASKISEILTN